MRSTFQKLHVSLMNPFKNQCDFFLDCFLLEHPGVSDFQVSSLGEVKYKNSRNCFPSLLCSASVQMLAQQIFNIMLPLPCLTASPFSPPIIFFLVSPNGVKFCHEASLQKSCGLAKISRLSVLTFEQKFLFQSAPPQSKSILTEPQMLKQIPSHSFKTCGSYVFLNNVINIILDIDCLVRLFKLENIWMFSNHSLKKDVYKQDSHDSKCKKKALLTNNTALRHKK